MSQKGNYELSEAFKEMCANNENKRKMKRKIYLSILYIAIAMLISCLFFACKKEKQPSCGTCDFCEHYSHNDSTFIVPGNKFCDASFDAMNASEHTYIDTIGGIQTTVHNYYNCKK